MQQVLTNLIMNAKDACLEPGATGKKILVRSRCAGIPDTIRERNFEPFFTSKPLGR